MKLRFLLACAAILLFASSCGKYGEPVRIKPVVSEPPPASQELEEEEDQPEAAPGA